MANRFMPRVTFPFLLLTGVFLLGSWPVTTRSGVNYQWSSKPIPLAEKAVHFLSRDLQTRRLSREIVRGASNEQEKMDKIFSWVTRNIRSVPPGFPVVDDHIQNIWIRGYGTPDQRAEVFALLSSYSGFSTEVQLLKEGGSSHQKWVAWVRGKREMFLFDGENQTLVRIPQTDPRAPRSFRSDRMQQQRPWDRLRIELMKLFHAKD